VEPHLIRWQPGALRLELSAGPDHPVVVRTVTPASVPTGASVTTQPLVELRITGDGPIRGGSGAGSRLRYREHRVHRDGDQQRLDVVQADARTGLVVRSRFSASAEVAGMRVVTEVRHDGAEPVVLEAITSFAFGAVVAPGERPGDLLLHTGTGDQLAENRWTTRPLWSQEALADIRSQVFAVGTSTWSTARALPAAVLSHGWAGRAFAWQIEHNGGWRWEVDAAAVRLMGPADLDHQFSEELRPGDVFTSVPVSVAVSDAGFEGAVAALTRHRRWLRRARTADRGQVLVFNDYMNTLNGDPTTAKLLPLVAAAGRAGAECFCIDAGWYDDSGDWWPSIGAWTPSAIRFPDGGLRRVTDAIHEAGMRVGLWLEPEAVGIRSPVAGDLPDEAFLQRHGRRIAEQQRHFLDLRHPAARAHLDAAFDRLVAEFGAGYFKLDHNVTPGPGTDRAAFSVGAGLLAHNRAYLDWFDALRARHPGVLFENCGSGAMRADFAQLERFDLQSTSDQQDFRRYAAIAAGAPMQMLPEQAGNWAYPQPGMTDEEIVFTMVTGLSGRLYLSGFLDGMSESQLELVRAGTRLFKDIRPHTATSYPSWPSGLPDWHAPAVSLVLRTATAALLFVWQRGAGEIRLDLGVAAGRLVERYPGTLPPWSVTDGPAGTVVLTPPGPGPAARVYGWAVTEMSPGDVL
jgi:alpha-galactosidase